MMELSVKPEMKVTIIPSEREAITFALTNPIKGSLLVLCSDVVPDALNLVMQYKEEESKQ
jgi:cyanophycin synthetase